MRVQSMIKQKKHGDELVMFSQARQQRVNEEEQYKLQKVRYHMYDRFLEMLLRFLISNLVEVLFKNKRKFKDIFRDVKNGPSFEVAVCFN